MIAQLHEVLTDPVAMKRNKPVVHFIWLVAKNLADQHMTLSCQLSCNSKKNLSVIPR